MDHFINMEILNNLTRDEINVEHVSRNTMKRVEEETRKKNVDN